MTAQHEFIIRNHDQTGIVPAAEFGLFVKLCRSMGQTEVRKALLPTLPGHDHLTTTQSVFVPYSISHQKSICLNLLPGLPTTEKIK